MLETKALILAKVETTYGTDANPTPANNAILTSKPSIELITEDKEREVVLPHYGKLASIPVGTGIKISFDVELKGSGTSTTPPTIGVLLRACGFTQTIGASNVTYNPNNVQDIESLTIYFYNDGILYKALGCVGNSVKLSGKANEPTKLSFEFTGLFNGIASFASNASFPTPTFANEPIPPVLRNGLFYMDELGDNGIIDSIEISITNTIAKRADVNSVYGVRRYSVTGREISGSFDPEVESLSSFNPWNAWDSASSLRVALTIGSVSGNMITFDLPNCQIEAPKLGAREGIQTYSISFKKRATLTAGLSEMSIIFS
jgi:hypothetical protein